MYKSILQICILLFCTSVAFAQPIDKAHDTTVNNLVHKPGYKTCELGSIPKYIKTGKGTQTLILIPGLGFDASVFKDFMAANKDVYTMYAITIPGYGKTNAPPMPPDSTSYGMQSWNQGVVAG
jgi:pimeloyl-ACP methyl ester carboxylesterase